MRLFHQMKNKVDDEDYEQIKKKINDEYDLDQEIDINECTNMNERVNEEHIGESESDYDRNAITILDLESPCDIESDIKIKIGLLFKCQMGTEF